jgi:hypothetical protein
MKSRYEEARERNLEANEELWKTEDEARVKEKGEGHVARCKGRIDELNQRRNEAIAEMDREGVEELGMKRGRGEVVTEGIGSVEDRICVMKLRERALERLKEAGGGKEIEEKLERVRAGRWVLEGAKELLKRKIKDGEAWYWVNGCEKSYNERRENEAVRKWEEEKKEKENG